MATHILLSIDTELTWRGCAEGAGWLDNFRRSFDPAGVGVPWQLEQLHRLGLKACFFVDPMPALVHGIEPIERMVEPILAAGQEVQLHLHPFWFDLAQGRRSDARFELTSFGAPEQKALIETARNLLVAAGAPPPVAFRAGSYAANSHTLEALEALGFAVDSSHNGAEHPWPSALPFAPETIDPVRHGALVELPIGQIRRRDGGLRPLQLCAVSSSEMQAALSHAAQADHPLVTIVSHSFELASRDGRRVNRLVRGRFEQLCAFVAERSAIMPTLFAREAGELPTAANSLPLPAQPVREWKRVAQQAYGDARYERPKVAAALVGAPSIAILGALAHAAL